MKTRCRHGHPWTKTKWRVHSVSGALYRQCLTCNAVRQKRRYACDPVYREAQKARVMAGYYRRLAEIDRTADFTVLEQEIRA